MALRLQRFVVVHKDKVIGTDSHQSFTEGAAHRKCAILQEASPKGTFKVVELTRLMNALS